MKSGEGEHLDAERFAIEKKELEAVLDSGIFAASSNAARLLRFVCERHFHDLTEATTEHDVAVHALGRRPDFDPQRDSIVRVEAHRVRKRLQQYYETEGTSHSINIVLPRGQYAPRFIYAESQLTPEGCTAAPVPRDEIAEPSAELAAKSPWAAPPPVSPAAPEHEEPPHTVRAWFRRPLRRVLVAGAMVAAALAVSVPWRLSTRHNQAANRPRDILPPAVGRDAVRILAGRGSGDYVDRAGTRWSADANFTGGTATAVRYYSLALADDPAIYEHARAGENFGYDIPLKPGVYEMRLMFAESAEVAVMGTVGDGVRSFHVTANGVQILPPLDGRHMRELEVVADAGGSNTADVKVFRDIGPAADGKLHLRFISRNQRALVNAIEIVPGLEGKMRPLRWRANETPYTDQSGNLWLSDRYFRGGKLSRFHATVSQTPDPNLYDEERFGSFTYSVPVAAGASYTVRMYFAENYFGGWAPPVSPPRIFSVYANHAPLLRDFDISREAGRAVTAVTKTFRGIRPNPFDKIELNFEPSTEFAIVNAIEVEDESK